MPELPEVETLVRSLKVLMGEMITQIVVLNKKSFIGDPRQVIGLKISNVERRGKYIRLKFETGEYLFIHLRMSGRLFIKSQFKEGTKHEHVVIYLSSHRALIFHDTRKFGRMEFVKDAKNVEDKLGFEPFDEKLTPTVMEQYFKKKSKSIKTMLLDQKFIAGLGNIYVDETLFEAHIHPLTLCASLKTKQIQSLLEAIRKVLNRGIDSHGTSLGNGLNNFSLLDGSLGMHQSQLKVYKRENQSCSTCKTIIKKIKVAQRGTHFCPSCQRTN